VNNFSSPTQGTELAHSWNATTFRLPSFYALIFSFSVMLLNGFIGHAVRYQ
jgi:hypothetical protein